MAGRSLTITYLANADQVLASQKQIDAGHSQLDSSTKKTGGVFQSTFGSVMPLAAAAAGAAVLKFAAGSIDAFKESEAAMAQTTAVLKSTGGAANVTADDVVALAGRLRDLSGADDEAIQASENLLLTFTRVRNEAGQGNDIFNQTEGAILDMATAMNNGAIPTLEDLNSKTILVGKAMNDPIRGLTALTRVGVTFSDKQRELITSMVESGDTMGAQKIILAELQKEFGGAAKAAGDTFAGAQAKAAQSIEDVQEVIGGLLLPVIADLSQRLADLLTDLAPIIEMVGRGLVVAFDAAAEKVEAITGPLQTLLDLIPNLSGSVEESSGLWKIWGDAIGGAVEAVIEHAVPGSQVLFDLNRASDAATEGFQTQRGVIGDLSDFYRGRFAESMDTATERTTTQTNATERLTDAQRENRLATLALTDEFLGIADSANAVSEAQRELNRLEEHGKESTKAYDEAVRDAIEAQSGLETAVLNYLVKQDELDGSIPEVRRKIKDLAEGFGIQGGAVKDLIAYVIGYIRELNRIPTQITTHIGTVTEGGWQTGGGFQHGGIITKPIVGMIGEAGPEAVIPLSSPRAGKMLGGGPSIVVNVAGSVISERDLADVVRDEFIRFTRRNPTTGF